MSTTGAPAVFVDRDGVVNALAPDPVTGLPESPLEVTTVRLLPGVGAALQALHAAGYLIICVTNQPAAAKGTVSAAVLGAVHEHVRSLLRAEQVDFDASEMCPHHPDAVVPELRGVCSCRKPEPGMLLAAAERLGVDLARSWMVGDSDSDIEAGRRAGCRTVLVEHPESAHRRAATRSAVPDAAVADLPAAASFILRSPSCSGGRG